MNMRDFYAALTTRLEASSNNTFRANLVYPFNAPPGVTPQVGALPVVTYAASWERFDSFTTDGYDARIVVTIMDHRANGMDPLFNAYDRVYGNPVSATKTAPTYGLHRHKLVLVGSNLPGTIIFERAESLLAETDSTAIGVLLEFSYSQDKG
jgi:hypothetical protein